MRMMTRTWRRGEVGGPGRGLGVDSFSTGLEDTAKKEGDRGARGEEAREEAGRREGPQG